MESSSVEFAALLTEVTGREQNEVGAHRDDVVTDSLDTFVSERLNRAARDGGVFPPSCQRQRGSVSSADVVVIKELE